MIIDEKLIKYLENLSFITLSDEERGRMCVDLEDIIAGMELLSQLDTGSVPMPEISLNGTADLRKDEVKPSFSRDEILKNAPQANGETFVVPQVVE